MRRLLLTGGLVAVVVAFLVIVLGLGGGSGDPSYKVELDNAFGLVGGSVLKIGGVPAGSITAVDLDQKTLHAVLTVQVTQSGFGFHADAFCESRPQSLIGEYFLDCDPGHVGPVLKSGSTIPVTQTESTIPIDLVANILRLPYRQRLALIINELGAAAAARSDDLQAALQRAVPALTQTDNLLSVLANDSNTLQQLTVGADAVVTALANNRTQVQRFIVEANNTASATATQSTSLEATLHLLPGFLEQLGARAQQLGAAVDANQPVLANLNQASGELNELFTNLPSFSAAAVPAVRALGEASVTGKEAVQAAAPTVAQLEQFAKPTPELSQNLAIVTQDLNSRSRAVEPNTRSPGGKGYTGLEAILQYVFNQSLAITGFGPFGHALAVSAFVDPLCSPYASPATVALNLQQFGAQYRRCYRFLGPSQPGVNEADPTNPGGCVPDPGGAPPGEPGPKTTVCKLSVSSASSTAAEDRAELASDTTAPTANTGSSPPANAASRASTAGTTRPPIDVQRTLSRIVSAFGSSATTASPAASSQSPGSQAQQLLNYLLAP